MEDAKTYEIGYLLKSAEAEADLLKVLAAEQCKILHQGKSAELKLSYPIEKQVSAFFGFVQFETAAENVDKIREALAGNANFLRFLIIKISSKMVSAQSAPAPAEERVERAPRMAEPKVSKPPVLSNEALEEKLEEILK